MNNQEAFETWWKTHGEGNHGDALDAWRAACEWMRDQSLQNDVSKHQTSAYSKLIQIRHGIDLAMMDLSNAHSALASVQGEQTK